MVKLNCPYCSKNYKKAKHFENHIERKHRRTIDLLSVPELDQGRIEQEMVRVNIPKNPLDMTPDILMRLSLEEYWIWLMDLANYKRSQDQLNKIFTQFGIQTTVEQELPPETLEKLRKLETYEREESIRKEFLPLMEAIRDFHQTMTEKEERILGEIKKIGLTLDLVLYNSLSGQSNVLIKRS